MIYSYESKIHKSKLKKGQKKIIIRMTKDREVHDGILENRIDLMNYS